MRARRFRKRQDLSFTNICILIIIATIVLLLLSLLRLLPLLPLLLGFETLGLKA